MRWRSRRRSTTEHGSQPPADPDEGRAPPRHDDDARALADEVPTGNVDVVGPGPSPRDDRPSERPPPALADEERAAAWLEAVTDASIEHRWSAPDAPTDAPPAPPTAPPPPPAGSVAPPSTAGTGPTAAAPAAPASTPTGHGASTPTAPATARSWATAARDIVRRALDEDLDVAGDVTAEATVPPEAVGTARIVARAEGVVAGLGLIAEVYDHLDPRVEVRTLLHDGERVRVGQPVAEVTGPLRSVLTGERTALNLVTHLSGVASVTAAYVEAVAGTGCEVRDTRKTTPGMRLLEKAAVRAGGGVNHRFGLSDALLVKENHVAAAGGVAAATRAAIAGARGRTVQVEVESPADLEEAVTAGARDVLLDNLDPEQTLRAVRRARELAAGHGRILLESSGGLDLERVRADAQAGVDRVAVGALTHSAPQLDLAMELDPPDGLSGGGSA